MNQKLLIFLKFSPLILLIGLFVYSFFNYGVLDHPGKLVYEEKCADCHGKKGEGIKQLIPPLLNADFAIANFDSIPCWIKNGMNQKIIVNEKEYEQIMYPIKLNEVETANVVNYIATEFLKVEKNISSTKALELLKNCE